MQRPTISIVRRGFQQGTPKPGDVVTARVRTLPSLDCSSVHAHRDIIRTMCILHVMPPRDHAKSCMYQDGWWFILQVTRINPRLASLDILCIGDLPLDTVFTGVIRWTYFGSFMMRVYEASA